ncbi:MAG: carboxypeptidase regulatory-like domain-containing protein, partial [Acidobacteriota bacterium]|nr:carboxypeptidase regulatory-like domain-containing protein [Acidobacteriota bacterium]
MKARTCGFFHFAIVWVLTLAGVAGAQAPAGTAILHGEITDPSGALIPGTTVTVTTSAGAKVATTTADAAGKFAVRGLAAGSYIVSATFNGFAPFQSQAIPLAAGQSKLVNISMAIQAAQQNVVVTTDAGPTVSVEADSNANAVVIKGKDIDALSDNPDELANELSALAGPAAGPNGGQIYIDGFSGGQLPPKSAIREIRVNQNPFSAEFD